MAASSPVEAEWSAWRVWRQPGYRRFLLALLLDMVTGSMWFVTLGWVASRADSQLATGVILWSAGLPLVILLLVGGAITDRLGSTRVAFFTLGARVVVLALWAAVAYAELAPLVLVAVAAGLVGAIDGVHEPAMFAYSSELVRAPAAQPAALFLERGTVRMAQSVGGVVAGYLIGKDGAGAPAILSVVLVLGAIGLLATVQRHVRQAQQLAATTTGDSPEPPSPSRLSAVRAQLRNVPGDVQHGLSFVRTHPVLRGVITIQSVGSIAGGSALIAILPIKAAAHDWSAADYGLGVTAWGVGMAVSTLLAFAAGVYRYSQRRRVLLALVLEIPTALALIALGPVRTPTAAAVCMLVMGLALGPVGPLLSGYLREVTTAITDDRLVARIGSILILATDGVEPFGFLLVGALSLISPDLAPWLLGIAFLLAALQALRVVRRTPALGV